MAEFTLEFTILAAGGGTTQLSSSFLAKVSELVTEVAYRDSHLSLHFLIDFAINLYKLPPGRRKHAPIHVPATYSTPIPCSSAMPRQQIVTEQMKISTIFTKPDPPQDTHAIFFYIPCIHKCLPQRCIQQISQHLDAQYLYIIQFSRRTNSTCLAEINGKSFGVKAKKYISMYPKLHP